MSGLGLLTVLLLLLLLGVGSGVMVFKHHVDEERERVVELRIALRDAKALQDRLRAEHAYHRRPAYLEGLASALGMTPATPDVLTTAAALGDGLDVDAWGEGARVVALPSGHRALLVRRPAQGSGP